MKIINREHEEVSYLADMGLEPELIEEGGDGTTN